MSEGYSTKVCFHMKNNKQILAISRVSTQLEVDLTFVISALPANGDGFEKWKRSKRNATL